MYQLKAVIEGMLADPRRGIATRASLHLGQAAQFVDFRDGQMRRGKIVAMKDTQATVVEEGTKRTRRIFCVAMQGYTDAERRTEQAVRATAGTDHHGNQGARVPTRVTPSRSKIATAGASPA